MPLFSLRHHVGYNIFALARAEMNSLDFWTSSFFFLVFLFFFCFSFSPFSYLFAAEIDLVLDLLPVQKILRKHHEEGQILKWSSHV